jgi:hypothetical protein
VVHGSSQAAGPLAGNSTPEDSPVEPSKT